MALSINVTAKRLTKRAKPADTNAATIYTVPTGVQQATIEYGVICSGATGASGTVMVNDGSTDWHLLSAKAVTAFTTETYDFGNHVLLPGESIKVQASAGNILTFHVTIAEVMRGLERSA